MDEQPLVDRLRAVDSKTDPQIMRLRCYSAADALDNRDAKIARLRELALELVDAAVDTEGATKQPTCYFCGAVDEFHILSRRGPFPHKSTCPVYRSRELLEGE